MGSKGVRPHLREVVVTFRSQFFFSFLTYNRTGGSCSNSSNSKSLAVIVVVGG